MKISAEPDFSSLMGLLGEPELFDPRYMPKGVSYLGSHSKVAIDAGISLGILPFSVIPATLGMAGVALVDRVNPVFRQTRIGRFGQPFRIAKTTTMPNALEDTHSNGRHDDERRSALGKRISLFRLDEALNIYNIAKREMSWVGPRPLLGSYLSRVRYLIGAKETDEWIKIRSLALPGIVDDFSIMHHSGKIEGDAAEQVLKRIGLESRYILETASPKEDLRIFLDTLALLGRTAAKHSGIDSIRKRFGRDAP